MELRVLFRRFSRITIFEIGACEGEDSIRYANLFPNSKIYAFEPLEKNVLRAKSNIEKYKKYNISIFPFALSDKRGSAKFRVSSGAPNNVADVKDWDFGNKSSSLLQPEKHLDIVKFVNFKEEIDVHTETLDSFCSQHGITDIDFIHMDVQGAELMVLNGAKETIKSIKSIWLEVSRISLYKDQPLYDDIKRFMFDNGYVLIKDTVDNITGDQLYISKFHFPNYKKLSFEKKHSGAWRIINKVKQLTFYTLKAIKIAKN